MVEIFGFELDELSNIPATIIVYVVALVLVFVIFKRMESVSPIGLGIKIGVPIVLLPIAYIITQIMANKGS